MTNVSHVSLLLSFFKMTGFSIDRTKKDVVSCFSFFSEYFKFM